MNRNVHYFEEEKALLTVVDLCAYLSIGTTTAYKLLNQRDFPTVKIRRRLYANRAELGTWILKQQNNRLEQ